MPFDPLAAWRLHRGVGAVRASRTVAGEGAEGQPRRRPAPSQRRDDSKGPGFVFACWNAPQAVAPPPPQWRLCPAPHWKSASKPLDIGCGSALVEGLLQSRPMLGSAWPSLGCIYPGRCD